MTVVLGCQARSVRDAARWYDVCAGYDAADPYSLPKIEGWERGLGSRDLRGRRAVIAPDLGSAVVRPEVAELVVEHGEQLAKDAGLELVDVPVQLKRDVGERWPGCKGDLTDEIAFGLTLAEQVFTLEMAAKAEAMRTEANQLMAELFGRVDFVISATNPDVAFPAELTLNLRVGDRPTGPENNGALTIPANIVGNPSVSIPIGTFDGLPVGMQVMTRHHDDALLFDLALTVERERPWPLVAPGAPV
jgi:aspartyl-tRNA(Asn)/glutamyl-tRNA(Gln) amidotransferase subunit A